MHRDAPLTPTTLASPGPQLPNETLHTIFAHLAGSPPALVAILRTCHHFRLIAERILYASIAIAEALPCAPSPVSESDPVSTSSLVHASVLTASTSSASSTSTLSYDPKSESESALPSMHTATCARTLLARPHLSEVVRMLSIRWHTDRDLAPSSDLSYAYLPAVLALLNRALRSLHHLEQLELAFGLAGAPLDAHAVLAGCAFSSLRAFALSGLSPSHASPKSHADPAPTPSPSPSLSLDAALSAFLSRTPSLTHLRLPDCHSPLALSPSALPLLQDFRGPAPAAASVLPGRRVARLALVGREPYVSARDLAGLARAAGPVRVLDLGGMSVSPLLLRDLAGVCCLGGGGGVEEMRVRLALRHTLHHALSGISILAGLTPVLGAFPALRTLDLSPTAVDGVGRGNALEEAALCTTWARACPALRCVVFPSGAVWRRRGGGEDGEGQGQGHGGEVWVPEAAAGVVWTRY